MELEKIFEKLKNSLERTGYISKIEIFPGEFHEDNRYDKNPNITYYVNNSKEKKETEMHRLEKEIRSGLYKQWHEKCHIRTCIELLEENLEKHTIHVSLSPKEERKERKVAVMASQLTKIIENYHFKK